MSKFYFFHGDKYCRYDAKADSVEAAYLPDYASITDNWSGLPAGVDAALNWGNGKTYFFVGSGYYRYDNRNDCVDPVDPGESPFPRQIAGNWPGLSLNPNARVDACLKWDTKTAYFFQGERYWAYDLVNDRVYKNYPRDIRGNWPPLDKPNILAKLSDFGFDRDLDAAVNWGNGKTYFFKGSKYVRYNMNPRREGVDIGYPQDINDGTGHANWHGLFPTGVRAPVMLGYAGFDRSDCPTDVQMQQLWDNTNLRWCGFYLAPTPSHTGVSWMNGNVLPIVTKLPTLQRMGWNVAPIYMGQQQADVPRTAHHASAAQGTLDASHAATLATAAGFPLGTIIYLDIEPSPTPLGAAMRDYYTSWVQAIATFGFRPGVYCPFQYAQTLLSLNSAPAFWVVNGTKFPGGSAARYSSPLFPAPEPLLTTIPFASSWQLALDVQAILGHTTISPWDCDSCSYEDPSSIP